MKNYSIEARIGVNGNKPTKCEFRIHDGLLFWHGTPKKYSQSQYDGFIYRTNSMLGPSNELTVERIEEAVRAYLTSGVFGNITDIEFAEFTPIKTVNEKTSTLAKYALSGGTPTAPTQVTEPVAVSEPTPEPEPIVEPTPEPTHEPVSEPVSEPTPMANVVTPQAPSNNAIADAFAALTPLFSGVQANVVAEVMAQVRPLLDELTTMANKQARKLVVTAPNGTTHTVSGAKIKNFDAMVQTIAEGDYLYLHGPAGCGKSYTAKQIADALGLKFYATQQLLYKHEAEGFVDANGTRHETAFSSAFINGGLLLLDEFDASSEEAAVVINNALANGVYDFPGLGQVQAHPDFRVIAAGNTGMTGADTLYTARRVLDASTKDRFFFVGVDYCPEVEQEVANYDDAIVAFVRDVRHAAETAGLQPIASYRMMKRLANTNLQQAWGDTELLRGAFTKEMGPDECRLIYVNLSEEQRQGRWGVALEALTHVQ